MLSNLTFYIFHMHIDQLHLTQITVDSSLIPVVFRGVFVIFLVLVMVLVKDDDHKEVKRIKD